MLTLEIQRRLHDLEAQLAYYEIAYEFPSAAWYTVSANRDSFQGISWSLACDQWAETYREWLRGLVAYRVALGHC